MTDPVLRSIAFAASEGTNRAEAILNTLVSPPVAMRDGDRWTAFDLGALTLAFAAPDDLPAGAKSSLNIKVDDVNAAYRQLLNAGASSAAAPATTAHEERASVWLSREIALSVYRSLPRS